MATAREDSTSAQLCPTPCSEAFGDEIPVPPAVPKGGVSILTNKLWIGNLDKRLTQQNILKFVTAYGKVVSFRYLFKGPGPERNEPKGYVFVEYSNREEAEQARVGLNGKKALGKTLVVEWAHPDQPKKTSNSVSETWCASSVSRTINSRASADVKIAALEAKLRQMEEDDLQPPNKRARLSPLSGHKTTTRPVY